MSGKTKNHFRSERERGSAGHGGHRLEKGERRGSDRRSEDSKGVQGSEEARQEGEGVVGLHGERGFCATESPWRRSPFSLISWLEMNKFSAQGFFRVGGFLSDLFGVLKKLGEGEVQISTEALQGAQKWINDICTECRKISLRESASACERLIAELDAPHTSVVFRTKLHCLKGVIDSELNSELFLWVPAQRAEWYGKSVEEIAGTDCMLRFPSVWKETEEASKCFALARYTACAFHLMRSTEAGVKALARAIKFTPKHDQWELVFKRLQEEFEKDPAQRPTHWKTHGRFIEEAWADMRVVSKAWRNRVMHLVDTYTEEEAKELLHATSMFLRHLATKMDESGKLY